jgi:hypothetical protein
MLATRLPMPRSSFDAWLTTPVPGLDVIENPSAMFTGWDNDGSDPDWDPTETAGSPAGRSKTPRHLLAARAAGGFTLARHRADALEIYLYDYHYDLSTTQTDLLMLAGAGPFMSDDADEPVMFWGGYVYPDLPINGDKPLAVMMVGTDRARFVDAYPIGSLIEKLRPIEADFLGAVTNEDDESFGWNSSSVLDPSIHAYVTATTSE